MTTPHPDLAPAQGVLRPWNNDLGDHWASVNLALTRSFVSKQVVLLHDMHPRLREILPLLNGPERSHVELTKAPFTEELDGFATWATPFWPTKTTWQPGSRRHQIAIHFDGHSSADDKNPPPADLDRIWQFLTDQMQAGYMITELGGHQSLAEMVEAAAGSDLFIGVDSGPSHVCHSVGVPMFLVEYKLPIITTHRRKHFVHCRGTDELLTRVGEFLSP
jgi:hypothetical protein